MEQPKIRKAAAAGQFYEAQASALKQQISALAAKSAKKSPAIACLVPHAGYIYSGRVAAAVLSQIELPARMILLGPNHTGYGLPFSLMAQGTWQTPLGNVDIDRGLAEKLLQASSRLKDDALAHLYEHSLEVELPFLQYFGGTFKFVPIAFMSDDVEALAETGDQIASVIKAQASGGPVLLVASSDMTHYEPEAQAQKKDNAAIQAILGLDEKKLAEKIQQLGISMCGYAPAIVMIRAAKALGARSGELVKYETSAATTGDKTSVVGYAGIKIY